MKRQTVNSSAIQEIGYDRNSQTLEIMFKGSSKDGQVYKYRNVPENVHNELINAPSVGTYFRENVKSVYTDYEKL